MEPQNLPINKQAISTALADSFDELTSLIQQMDETGLNKERGGKWTKLEIFQHLIMSCAAVASALKMPKEVIANFGLPGKPSRKYEKLKADYAIVLSGGVNVVGRFAPNLESSDTKEVLLGNWKMVKYKFQERMDLWSDEALEKYGIPHPIMGLFTVNEMLIFTILHNWHHYKQLRG